MALKPRLRPEGDERWMYVARRHWVALLVRGSIPLAVALVAAILFITRGLSRQPDFLGATPPLFDGFAAILAGVVLVMMLILVYIYLDWRNDFLILSNKRVILEDQTLLIRYVYETIPLERIQNVNLRSSWVDQWLKYGTVTIQASGPSEPIVFKRARRAAEVQQRIMKEVSREKRELEKRRLDAVAQRRLNPGAPPVQVPNVPVEHGLMVDPRGIKRLFPLRPILQNGNTIIWHRHWIVLLHNLLIPLGLLLLWIGLLGVLPTIGLLAPTTTTIVLFVLLLGILAGTAWQIENWRNDVYMLDPTRLIDVNRLPLGIREDRREASLSAIQNVNALSPNFFARLLGYGNVEIETAGSAGNLTFTMIHDPQQVQRAVFEYMDRFKWNQREREWNTAIDIVESYQRVQTPPHP